MPGVMGYLRRRCIGANARLRRARSAVGCLGTHGLAAVRIPTYTYPEELTQLYRLAAAAPVGCDAVEIGSYLGASTCYLAAGLCAAGGRLTCIDTWENQTMLEGTRDTLAEFQRNVAPWASRMSLIRKNSRRVTPDELPATVHLAFIDGDHSHEASLADFELVASRIPVGGVVAFHDCSRIFPGVPQTVGKALGRGGWILGGLVNTLCWVVRIS